MQAIPPASRSTLINDAFNLARAGYLDIKVALNISKYLIHERDFVPWTAADDVLGFIESMLRGTEAHDEFVVIKDNTFVFSIKKSIQIPPSLIFSKSRLRFAFQSNFYQFRNPRFTIESYTLKNK